MVQNVTPTGDLQPPQPITTVTKDQAGQMIKLEPATMEQLDAKVAEFVALITQADVHSQTLEQQVAAIHALGTKEIREAANVSNRILNEPVRGLDEDSQISQSLLALRKLVENLDPAQQNAPKRRFLGIIPLGSKAENYFLKYQSAQSHIDAILNALYHGQDVLRQDNATLEQEKVNLWEIMERLQQYVYVCRRLDDALSERIAEIEADDPEKARVVKEEMLFYIRQKSQDLLTQLAVSIQGYLALDVIRKNNLELIKGVDRATTTTISALRTAVIVAQAMTNQKLVLDQVNALNTTTGNLLESTSALLQGQSAQVHQQAASATVSLEQLKAAFENIYATMDMISNYKVEALDSIAQTVNSLATEANKAQRYVDRVRAEIAVDAAGELTLPLDEKKRP